MYTDTTKVVIAVVVLILVLVILNRDIIASSCYGWVLFYSDTCSHCTTQLNNLGYIGSMITSTVNCSLASNAKVCEENKIVAYPTWINKKYKLRKEGVSTPLELNALAKSAKTVTENLTSITNSLNAVGEAATATESFEIEPIVNEF